MILRPYMQFMAEKDASDLYVSGGAIPQARIAGKVVQVGRDVMPPARVAEAAGELMGDRERAIFKEHWDVDFSVRADKLGRYRVNVFRQRGQVAMVLRHVPAEVPTLADLHLPEVLGELAMSRQGLLLMAGPTGSGKSSTLAAMLGHRNEHMAGHILTIEDPIEFFHPNRKSIINQRELGVDAHSFETALRSALRESPDVVMIGEARDRDTMAAAMELAGTGHLSMATLHANNAAQALDRLASMFPGDMQEQMHLDLSDYLLAVVSQRLVVTEDGSRVPAVEVMINTPFIADLIAKGHFDRLKSAMQESKLRGMRDMDTALYALVEEGVITREEALAHADSRSNLEAKINFASN